MYLEVAIVWCKLWSLGELSSQRMDKVGNQAGGRVVGLAEVVGYQRMRQNRAGFCIGWQW